MRLRRGDPAEPKGQLVGVAELPGELVFLGRLVAQVLDLLLAGSDPEPAAADPMAVELGLADLGRTDRPELPADPALARLFPDAYGPPAAAGEPDRAGEFRRLTEGGLRATKIANLRVVAEGLARDPVVVLPSEIPAWLAGVNDIRLVLGSRLGLEDDESMSDLAADLDPDRSLLADAYLLLTAALDDLVQAASRGL